MGKGMFSGVVWGTVSGIAVMAVLSLYAPLPGEVVAKTDASEEPSNEDASPIQVPEQSSEKAADPVITPQDAAPETEVTEDDPEEPSVPTEVVEAPEPSVPTDVVEAPQAPDLTQTAIAEPEAEAPADPTQPEIAAAEDVPLPEIVIVRPSAVVEAPNVVEEEAEVEIALLDQTPPALLDDAPEVTAAPEEGPSIEAPQQLARAPEAEPLVVDRPAAAATDQEITPEAPSRSEVTLVEPDQAPETPEIVIDTPVLPVSGESFDAPERPNQTLPREQADVPAAVGDEVPAVAPPENTQLALELQQNRSRLPTIGDDAEEESSSGEPITLPVPDTTAPTRKVVTNRLPSITAPAPVEEDGQAEEVAEPAEDAAPEQSEAAPTNALQAFAAEIEVPVENDLVGLILIDDESSNGMPMGDMLQLAVPFSIAIDPSRVDAADRAAQYRAAGIEVLAMIEDLPPEAAPADVAVAMESYFSVLEEAIGVLDPLDARIQGTRSLITPVVDALSLGGRALVTYDRGLNPAQQLAERVGVPAATVFRILDGEAEEAPKIKRYLDRAAFNANRDGAVVVLGRNYPETVKALLEWSLSEKGAGLSVVPVSKLLLAD